MLALLGCLVQGDSAAEEGKSKLAAHYEALDAASLGKRMASGAKRLAELPGASFTFDDPIRRQWDFWPSKHPGARLDRLPRPDQAKVEQLLRLGLSESGSRAVDLIAALEPYNPYRSPYYSLAVFGDPSGKWGWRYQGHHISLNFTLAGDRILSATPLFLGSQPLSRADVAGGAAPLEDQQRLAQELYRSLDADRQRKATVERPGATYLPLRTPRAKRLEPAGVPAAELDAAQRQLLVRLVRAYVDQVAPAIAEREWAEIEAAGVERIGFAWDGPDQTGRDHYYRLQGPTFIIEYDSRDAGSHIHCVWRSFDGDFGSDLLARHLATAHSALASAAP